MPVNFASRFQCDNTDHITGGTDTASPWDVTKSEALGEIIYREYTGISLTHSPSIPPPLSTPGKCDSSSYDNARFTTLANNTLSQDDAIEHGYEALEHTHITDHILYYDLFSLGFKSTAQILAPEISSDFAISSYLNLGTGSGLTARACVPQLPQLGADSKIVIIDGLEGMMIQAKNKLELALNVADTRAPERLLTYLGDVTVLPPTILQDTQNKWGFTTFSLLTAQ